MVGTVLEQYVNKLDIQGVPKKIPFLSLLVVRTDIFWNALYKHC